MTVTLEEVRTDVRNHVDESVAGFYDDSMLNTWIYEGTRDIARRCEVLQSVKSIDLIANEVNYDVPLDMLRIHRVEFRQNPSYIVPLEYRTIDSMDDVWWTSREVASSEPMFWSIWGTPGLESSQLYIFPISSTTIEDGLRLMYYRLPRKPVQDEDIVEVPAGWQDLVVLYCEMNALRRAGSPRWQEAQVLYETRLQSMMDVTRQWSDQQTLMTGSRSGSRIPWLPDDPWW